MDFRNACHTKTIAVEIASYCDPEVVKTVKSAIVQAEHIDRVRFIICLQDDSMLDYLQLKYIKNVELIHLTKAQSTGPCKARYLCQRRITTDDDFVFHIDSHMRFCKHWDTKQIESWYSLNDPMAIISAYPDNCCREEMMLCDFNDSCFDEPTKGFFQIATSFRKTTPSCECISTNVGVEKYYYDRNPYIAGGYFFAPAHTDYRVLIDPDMYYFGDEFPVAVRLYTYGYHVYTMPQMFVYHQYCRSNKVRPSGNIVTKHDCYERERMCILFGLKEDVINYNCSLFGLGRERTVAEFATFAGLDFQNKIILSDSRFSYENWKKENNIRGELL